MTSRSQFRAMSLSMRRSPEPVWRESSERNSHFSSIERESFRMQERAASPTFRSWSFSFFWENAGYASSTTSRTYTKT